MHLLSEEEFQLSAQPMMQKVFREDREWYFLFKDEIDTKRILYELNLYTSHGSRQMLLSALVEAAKSIDDEACYLSEMHFGPKERKHACIPLSELLEGFTATSEMSEKLITNKLNIDSPIYFVIYSEQGKWGLFPSFEHFGFLGGSPDFMHVIESRVPGLEVQTYEFLQYIQGENTSREITAQSRPRVKYLLEHMYGSIKAERFLQETGWY
ncbi:MAG: hypothetical protein ACFB12_17925 [Leptolyngbyaceae cyanobacterium]